MNDNAKLWVAALRNQNFREGHNALRTTTGYCPLGVAVEVYRLTTGAGFWRMPQWEKSWTLSYEYVLLNQSAPYPNKNLWMFQPPDAVALWLGLKTVSGEYMEGSEPKNLIGDYDGRKKTFKEIADIIESEPVGMFGPLSNHP